MHNKFVARYIEYRKSYPNNDSRHLHYQVVAASIAWIGEMEDLQALSDYFEQETKDIFNKALIEMEELINESITTAI